MNEDHVYGSPFAVEIKARQFRCVSSFGQKGSVAGMLSKPWGVAVNERNEIVVTETDYDSDYDSVASENQPSAITSISS